MNKQIDRTNKFSLVFEGHYGDIDYDGNFLRDEEIDVPIGYWYKQEFLIDATEKNKKILEQLLDKLPNKPDCCINSQDFTKEVNELLKQIEPQFVHIDKKYELYPYWDLYIYDFDSDEELEVTS